MKAFFGRVICQNASMAAQALRCRKTSLTTIHSSLLPASAKKLSSRQQPLHCVAVNRAAAILLAILSSQWCTREKAIRTAAVDRENVAQTLQRTFPTAKDREEKRDEVRVIETTDEEF